MERLGRYQRTLDAGLALVVPYVDRVRPLIDLREQVVSFPPQPVITEDNLVINIDTVIYFQVTDPKAATYEIADYIAAIEQLVVTTLRNVIGGMNLEETLTSRDKVSGALRIVLDEATGRWGIRVNRVELKAVDPPHSIQEAMEKQMRAERDRRAAILTAEGVKQSQILTAEGEKQSAILRAEGEREVAMLEAEGEAKAIETVFDAIHRGDADPKLLAYQYLRTLPQIADGEASKVWIVPGRAHPGAGQPGRDHPQARRRAGAAAWLTSTAGRRRSWRRASGSPTTATCSSPTSSWASTRGRRSSRRCPTTGRPTASASWTSAAARARCCGTWSTTGRGPSWRAATSTGPASSGWRPT